MQSNSFLKSYEQALGSNLYNISGDKTFVDKTLAKSDVEELKDIMQKERLDRKDLLKLLYLLAGTEIKLVNFGEFDRYLLGKFYAWVRDFVANAEFIYDILQDIESGKIVVTDETKELLADVRDKMLHNIKFLADVFLYLGRSTLSLEATAFDTITKTRYEYHYPSQAVSSQPAEQPKGFWFFRGGK